MAYRTAFSNLTPNPILSDPRFCVTKLFFGTYLQCPLAMVAPSSSVGNNDRTPKWYFLFLPSSQEAVNGMSYETRHDGLKLFGNSPISQQLIV